LQILDQQSLSKLNFGLSWRQLLHSVITMPSFNDPRNWESSLSGEQLKKQRILPENGDVRRKSPHQFFGLF
jgi:hypothetical protein